MIMRSPSSSDTPQRQLTSQSSRPPVRAGAGRAGRGGVSLPAAFLTLKKPRHSPVLGAAGLPEMQASQQQSC